MTSNACDMACEILSRTADGEQLDPTDLKLLETAVNGWLTEPGEVAFFDLYHRVASGDYRKPWLHGVEYLTRDHEGYVYWKGHQIEHWSGHLPYSEEGRKQALELRRRCLALESRGEPVTTTTVIWHWED